MKKTVITLLIIFVLGTMAWGIIYVYDFYNIAKAEDNLNLNYCKKIFNQSKKDYCFYSVAKLTSDEIICQNIIDTSFRDNLCYQDTAVIKNNYEVCKNISTQRGRDVCYTRFVNLMNEKNPNICNLVEDADTKNRCLRYANPQF